MCLNESDTGSAVQARALCVSIHDVAPSTWAECLHLLRAVREVADIPLTWLVVPHYHGSVLRSRPYEQMLGALLAQGHELALHGYTHRDEAPLRGTLLQRLLRTVYTQREGEFAAIDGADARRRIELGLAWFAERGWPVEGFVAPAWLLGKEAWAALADYPFIYTTTYAYFHGLNPRRKLSHEPGRERCHELGHEPGHERCHELGNELSHVPRHEQSQEADHELRPERSLHAPALVYAARNRAGRVLSPPVVRLAALAQHQAPLVRLALHPRDARHPALVAHAQRLIAHLLASREALTKGAFARVLAGLPNTGPSVHPCPSAHAHRQPSR